jgi:hypothetical protein
MYLCPSITIDIVTSVILYYALYAVPGVRTVLFAGIFAVVTIIMLPLLLRLVERVDKNRIYYTGIPLSILAMVGIAFYPSGTAVWPVYVLSGVFAMGLAAAQVMVWVMFPDVVDDGEVTQGARNAGRSAASWCSCGPWPRPWPRSPWAGCWSSPATNTPAPARASAGPTGQRPVGHPDHHARHRRHPHGHCLVPRPGLLPHQGSGARVERRVGAGPGGTAYRRPGTPRPPGRARARCSRGRGALPASTSRPPTSQLTQPLTR